jgi:hypothetical protein
MYVFTGIPCRINHGSIKNKLQWDVQPALLAYVRICACVYVCGIGLMQCFPSIGSYNPLLTTAAEGFLETEHPFVFVSKQFFFFFFLNIHRSCSQRGGGKKIKGTLDQLVLFFVFFDLCPCDLVCVVPIHSECGSCFFLLELFMI